MEYISWAYKVNQPSPFWLKNEIFEFSNPYLLLDLQNSLIAQIIHDGANPLLFTKPRKLVF